jgi:hypothetical protein
MQKSVQAALYSVLIFPGAGLYWLKCYWQAALFILPALAISIYIVRESLAIAHLLSDQIANSTLPLEVIALTRAIEQTMQQLTLSLSSATWLFMFCWVLSIAASYVAGKQQEPAIR